MYVLHGPPHTGADGSAQSGRAPRAGSFPTWVPTGTLRIVRGLRAGFTARITIAYHAVGRVPHVTHCPPIQRTKLFGVVIRGQCPNVTTLGWLHAAAYPRVGLMRQPASGIPMGVVTTLAIWEWRAGFTV